MARIRGGMEFRQGAIVRLPPPPRTLTAHPIRLACSTPPLVAHGETVRRGQVIADPPELDRPCVISPVTGMVSRVWHTPDNPRQPHGLIIQPSEPTVPTTLNTEPPRGRTLDNWFDTLRRFGPWQDGDGRLDFIAQLHAAREKPPAMLICVGLDAFPPYPDRSSLLASFPDDAVLGTQILADIVGARRVLMLAPLVPAVLNRLKPSCRNFRVPLTAATNIYPSADPTLVMWAHAPGRRKLPQGALPTDRNVMMIGPWTAIRLARWFTNRELDLARPLFIGWPEPGTPLTPGYALPGQPLASVHGTLAGSAASLANRVVLGNPMTGTPVPIDHDGDRKPLSPVVPADHVLLSVLGPMKPHRAEPCISCGWCAEVCPTDLRPIRLVQLLERQTRSPSRTTQRRIDRSLKWCIDCGLCSHVCPSDIPLAQTLRQAMQTESSQSPNEGEAPPGK